MATVVHILLTLVLAILRAFVTAFLHLFSTALTAFVTLAGIVILILVLTGSLSVEVFRRRK